MFQDKVILITGGTGSLGKELSLKLLDKNPHSIRLFARSEYRHWMLKRDPRFEDDKFRFLIGDIREKDRLWRAMDGVDIVIHAAALKHVDLCQFNPFEAVKTNVLGTMNVIETSLDRNVKKVMAISSDKAVYPVNIYGATKQTMEHLVTQANVYGETKFSCCRFGNFMGSAGSVIEKWYNQLEAGEPLTVTELDMVRLWTTAEKAAEFTLDRLKDMLGGEIFIPKMESQTLGELIATIAPNADIKEIGSRIGEKKEELIYSDEEKATLIDNGDYFTLEYWTKYVENNSNNYV